MYGYPLLTRGFSLIKILSGLSKGLTIANQVIPIYKKAKPMVNNTKTIFKSLKEINMPDKKKSVKIKKESITDSNNLNNPKFFI